MNGASHELDDDPQRETSGTPPQDDPAPGADPQVEADTCAEDPTDTDSDAQVQPASDQEDSSGPDTESEAATAAEVEAEQERPSEATGSEEEDETAADAEDEQEEEGAEQPETSSESPEPDEADADGDGDEGVTPEDAAPEDTVASEDTAAPEDTAPPEDTPASEHAAAAEDTHASEDTAAPDEARPEQADEPEPEPEQPEPEPEPDDEPGPGEEVKGCQEDGRTVTAEFRLPLRPQPSAPSDHSTVSDLPRAAFPPARTADTEFTPTAPHHPPSTEEPRPTRSAPEPVPWPGRRGAHRRPETDTTAPPHDTIADIPITRPAPDRGAPEPATDAPWWQERTPGPSAYSYPPAPPTVEEALPELRPFTRGDFAGTAQMDGLLTTDLPAAYTAPPPQMAPPPPFPATPPPRTVQPPVTEAPAQAPAEEPRRKRRTGRVIVVVALVLLAGLVTGQLVRPTPRPTLRLTLPTAQHTFGGAAPVLPWPVQGQATLYVEGVGTMGTSGGQAPTPTASVAKVMTAYVVLRDHPLQPGAQGPTFRISPQEAARLPARKRRGESLVEVVAGQAFTQHKALEALMIVSANNVAHELARWDSGGEQAFVQKMNAAARSLGMTDTIYTDPSGFDSRTVSTAADQVKLLTAAMKIPAFAEIVRNRTYVPNDGRPPRSGGDVLVGRHGVVGGKTGYTDAAGGNFVFAAHKRTGGVTTTIVGAVMGQQSPSAMGAITVAQRLVIAAEKALASVTLAQAGARVAVVDDGLGGRTPLRAAVPVTVVGWGGLTVPVRVTGDPRRHAAGGTRLGAVTAGSAVTPLTLDRELKEPSILRRLLRLA